MLQRLFVIVYIIIICSGLQAQKSPVYNSLINEYQQAVALFNKEKYAVAQERLDYVIDKAGQHQSILKSEATYYRAMCAVKLFNNDAVSLVVGFIKNHPENDKINRAKFELGRFHYKNKDYLDAITWFDSTDAYDLSREAYGELFFKKGYSEFKIGQYQDARVSLYELLNKNLKYTPPARYYYAHVNYAQKNYQTALNNFKQLADDPTFAPIIPYYLLQIYYVQGKYDSIISFTKPLMDSVQWKRKDEIFRIVGEAYYNNNAYDTAIVYLNKYVKTTNSIDYKDKYHLAYSYYRVGNCKEAIDLFRDVANKEDVMSQNALYHLADCYIKTGDKEKARLAFSSASNMDYDSIIRRDALFNYALLTYELAYSPFNEAIKALNQYIEEYPLSDKTNEAYKYLVMAYLNTKNYKDALFSLEKSRIEDEELERAYQRVAFFRALELFKDMELEKVIDLLDKSLKYASFDRTIKLQAYYWKAEALYRLEEYQEAIKLYKDFINAFGAFNMDNYYEAHYGLGYAYFNLDNYNQASTWFRKYINFMNKRKSKKVADAFNRIGDCFYMIGEYWRGIDFYDQAISMKMIDRDYALFQKGFSFGLVTRYEKKVKILEQLIQEYPKSNYYDDALYELGRAYVELNDLELAVNKYNQLLKEQPKSNYVPNTLVKLGLIYYNQDENENALKVYKRVVQSYPTHEERKNALTGIKNIYIDMNNVDGYFEFVENLGGIQEISDERKDSLRYATAENVYMKGDCDKAISLFNSYLKNYPGGGFELNAHYYMGNCYYKQNNYEKALPSFLFIIEKPQNTFTEEALQKAARIEYQAAHYNNALRYYSSLRELADERLTIMEAILGIMRCHYELQNYEEMIEVGNEVLVLEKLSDVIRRETRYKVAKSLLETGKVDRALDTFAIVAMDGKSAEGAEANYRMAKIYYDKGDYEQAKEEIYEFIDMKSPHQFWVAKSFILIARIFDKEGDRFQAVHTLNSIIKNYDDTGDGIIEEAKQLKEEIALKNSDDQ
jgi:TolA-binding protein